MNILAELLSNLNHKEPAVISATRLSSTLIAALAISGCRPAEPEQRYGFLAKLGNDTVSVESVSRRGNKVVIDGVDKLQKGAKVAAKEAPSAGAPRATAQVEEIRPKGI